MYHLGLASGASLKVHVGSDSLGGAPGHGDTVWAQWLPTSQVVLTA